MAAMIHWPTREIIESGMTLRESGFALRSAIILAIVEACEGDMELSAERAGIASNDLNRWIRKLRIRADVDAIKARYGRQWSAFNPRQRKKMAAAARRVAMLPNLID